MSRYRVTLLSLSLLATLGATAAAQGHRHGPRGHVYLGRPYHVQPFYGGYYAPYYGSYLYGPYFTPYGYHRDPYETSGVRLKVKPNDARVLVDGYYAGTVDDFDGTFQQLDLQPGRHEIALKREGYRTYRFRFYAVPGRTVKVSHEMEKGAGQSNAEDLGRR